LFIDQLPKKRALCILPGKRAGLGKSCRLLRRKTVRNRNKEALVKITRKFRSVEMIEAAVLSGEIRYSSEIATRRRTGSTMFSWLFHWAIVLLVVLTCAVAANGKTATGEAIDCLPCEAMLILMVGEEDDFDRMFPPRGLRKSFPDGVSACFLVYCSH